MGVVHQRAIPSGTLVHLRAALRTRRRRRQRDGKRRAPMLLHELGHPGGLLGDEGVQRHLAGLDHIERLLPDGGHAGIGDGGRDSVDEREGRSRRADGAALPQQVAAIEQARDRAGARGLGADARRLLQLLLQTRVVHQLGHTLHRLDQFALGVGLGRQRFQRL